MSEQIKKALVPELRFPEFRDQEVWEVKKFENIAAFYKGKGVSKADIDQQGKTQCIRYGELYTHYNEVIYSIFSKTNVPESELFLSERNDVIIPSSGETKWDIATASCVMLDGVALGGDLNVIRSNENGVFISYYLNGAKRHEISKIAQGDTVVHLYSSQLKLLNLLLPTKPEEQQKIADCLSSIDKLITAQAQKLAALKTHKKGLMQQLFPAKGETVPKLRFPEFRDAGEWKEKPLGEFIEEYRKSSSYQDEFEVLTSSRTGLVKQRDYYDNSRITERDNIGSNVIPPNYLTYRSRSDDRRFFFNENTLGITGIISTYYPVFRIINGSNKFFIELLSQYSGKVGKHSVGTSQTVLSFNELKRVRLPLPKEESEQQKIADCLSSIDELITAQTQKLAALKAHKKGLMQQLFPAADEVNG